MGETRNTLLTGFGSFEQVISNPTERLVRHFENCGTPGHRLTTFVLPVSYRRAPALLLDALQRGDPDGQPFDLLWMLGVAANSPHWRVERCAVNKNGAAADADGEKASPLISEAGPERLEVNLPVQVLVTSLANAGLPAVESGSAGVYLCNHMLYTALRHRLWTGVELDIGFLHVPADPETMASSAPIPAVTFSFEHQIRAVELSLAKLADLRSALPKSV